MKRALVLLPVLLLCLAVSAQETYKITYHYFREGAMIKQDPVVVFAQRGSSVNSKLSQISGQTRYPAEMSQYDYANNTVTRYTLLEANQVISMKDTTSLKRYSYEKLPDQGNMLGYKTLKAKTSLNSNSIEIIYTTDLGIQAAPNDVGQALGLVLVYKVNGSSGLRAASIEKLKSLPTEAQLPKNSVLQDELSYRDIIWKRKFIQIPIFQNQQISFQPGIASDSIMRFAEGTVILKKVKIPSVSLNSQAFIELVQTSNGDAYDRTGSVFLIAEDQKQSFLDGMKDSVNVLPKYLDGNGQVFPGMIRTEGFSPVYELMRFFTPFGVKHFNDRVKLKGKTWQDSAMYRQEISEFLPELAGKEVYIGTYIGNYDKGGHKVSLELTIHPGRSIYPEGTKVMPLFNTTNILEMAGQEYPTMYGHEKGLEFEFNVPTDMKNVKLRYISTGHGGWGNGDEFNPKPNTIFLDGNKIIQFTPWRIDCGSYRLYNPVSGNFENGLSSSDLSRSNWCPGTITNPVYIDFGDLKAGKHTIKIHIPQGAPEGTSKSFWNTSGTLVYQ